MVLTFQVPTAENTGPTVFPADTKAALDFLTSSRNPRRRDLDPRRIGLAGHSAGGFAVSQVGQEDPRVSAIVSWDRAQSSPMRADLPLRTPALYVTADYNCQKVPVCVPQPYTAPPDPHGDSNAGGLDGDAGYLSLSKAGVDSELVSFRNGTHLTYTYIDLVLPSNELSERFAFYYTLAWFDRYLRRGTVSRRALRRLVAPRFDRSGDVDNISAGAFDPTTQSNVPAFLAGQPVVDRLSFHFRSGYWLDHGRTACDDIRAGCPR